MRGSAGWPLTAPHTGASQPPQGARREGRRGRVRVSTYRLACSCVCLQHACAKNCAFKAWWILERPRTEQKKHAPCSTVLHNGFLCPLLGLLAAGAGDCARQPKRSAESCGFVFVLSKNPRF